MNYRKCKHCGGIIKVSENIKTASRINRDIETCPLCNKSIKRAEKLSSKLVELIHIDIPENLSYPRSLNYELVMFYNRSKKLTYEERMQLLDILKKRAKILHMKDSHDRQDWRKRRAEAENDIE